MTRDAPGARDSGPERVGGDARQGDVADAGAPHDAGAPWLVALDVTGGASGLVPAFAPDVYDYYVRCRAGANALVVSMTASPGATAALLQPTASTSMPQQTVDVSAAEGAALVAAATSGSVATHYWVRCLPHDFSPMTMVYHPEAGVATPGYYLVGNETSNAAGGGYAMVLDSNGVPVWYASQPQTAPLTSTTGAFDVDSIVDGAVSFIPWPSVLFLSPYEIRGFSPVATADVAGSGWALDPHELRVLANGDYLMFTNQVETGVDMTGYDVVTSAVDGGVIPYGPDASIIPCDVLEVAPSGEVVWTWIGTDHIDPVADNIEKGLDPDPAGTQIPDPYHCNSIDVDPENGNLLVSSRHEDAIFYIDRSTGTILWKMGGVDATLDDATYVPVADPFHRQHDVRFMPGWSATCGGQISVFDDESYQHPPVPARGVVYDVTVDVLKSGAAGCGAPAATVAWQWVGGGTSIEMGSFRTMPDGTRIIGWGVGVVLGLVFTEVSAEGNDVKDFYFNDNSTSYRAVKVPLAAFDLSSLRANTGLP